MPKAAPEIRINQLTIDKDADVPLYKQLYENLRTVILQGTLRPGQRLPATRSLSEDLGISRNCVSKAFEQLTIEGYLKPAVGSGTYVNDTLPDTFIQTSQAKKDKSAGGAPFNLPSEFNDSHPFLLIRNIEPEPIVPFQNAVPAIDSFPFKVWSSIATRQYRNMHALPLGYDDAAGYLPLRQAIESYVRMFRGVKCEFDQILIVHGTQQALSMLASTLVKPNTEVLLEDPGYVGARAAFADAKARICPVPVESDGLDVAYAMKHFPKAKCAYLTPAHQYPLGGTLSLNKRIAMLEWAHQANAWILEDDYDSELRYHGKPLAALQGLDVHGRVIYIGTFSKVIYPGLRIGYIVFPSREMAAYFTKIKAIFDRQSPIMEQAILAEFISQGHFFRHLRRIRMVYSERQQFLMKAISREAEDWFSVEPEEAGLHLIAWLKKNIDDKKASGILAKEGIVANALSDYVIEFKRKPALILGYSAYNKFKLRHHMTRVNQIMERHFTRG